jgi:GNAT superfamily N-acetyltransferase
MMSHHMTPSGATSASSRRLTRVSVRDLLLPDVGEVLELVTADSLPCRPRPGAADVEAALAMTVTGLARGDAIAQRSVVAVEGERLAGTASWLERRCDGERFLLWLHGHERPEVVAALLDAATEGASSAVRAFTVPTPVQPFPAGLPVWHRPGTHAELLAGGFVGHHRWLLLEGTPPSAATRIADVRELLPDRLWHLSVTASDQPVAEMRVQLDRDQIGEVQWIAVAPACRGRGLGRRLLAQGLRFLAEQGARRVFLAVDADSSSRQSALHLYRSAGFQVVDHLWSYRQERRRAATVGPSVFDRAPTT